MGTYYVVWDMRSNLDLASAKHLPTVEEAKQLREQLGKPVLDYRIVKIKTNVEISVID